jgi:membrane protein required for colicin V production
MIIDLIFAVLIVLAAINGYRRGLIVAVFSVVALIIGIAAAMKLSTVVANYIGHAVKISDKWLPIISFVIVLLVVILLVRWGANALQKIVESIMLGFFNRLGGILLYAAIYVTVYSILLFYAKQMKLINPDIIHASVTYSFIEPWGPKAINAFGAIIPFFKDMFTELEQFFSGVSAKMAA